MKRPDEAIKQAEGFVLSIPNSELGKVLDYLAHVEAQNEVKDATMEALAQCSDGWADKCALLAAECRAWRASDCVECAAEYGLAGEDAEAKRSQEAVVSARDATDKAKALDE